VVWGSLKDRRVNETQIQEIRSILEGVRTPEIDENRKQNTLELLRMERKRLHMRSRKTYGRRLLEQTAYLSPAAWLIQGTLVLSLAYGFLVREKEEMLLQLLLCAPVIGIVGFTELMRSYRQNMWELEQACRYNLRQLMGMRLLIFGIADSLVACSVAIMGWGTGIRTWEVLIFFFIPQILSDCVYLYLMTRFRRHFQGTALLGSAVLMTILWMWILQGVPYNPKLMRWLADPFALILILFISTGLLSLCCVRFLKETETEYCAA
jgi:hypothetical protein